MRLALNCIKVRGHWTGLKFSIFDNLNMRSMDKLRTIFEVGFKTVEKLEVT